MFLLSVDYLTESVDLSSKSSNSSVILNSIRPSLKNSLSAHSSNQTFSKRTRNGRFLLKKIMNLVEGCNQQGCCSKGLNSLFGFSGDCCDTPKFNDDGLEDYRPRQKHYHVTKSRTPPDSGAQKIYIAVIKKEPPKIRKTNYDKIKENEKILEKWPEGLMLSKTDESTKATDFNGIKKLNEQSLSYIDYEMIKNKDQQQKSTLSPANGYRVELHNPNNLNDLSHQSLKPLNTLTKFHLKDNDDNGERIRDKFRIETKSQKLYESIPSTTKTINLKKQT